MSLPTYPTQQFVNTTDLIGGIDSLSHALARLDFLRLMLSGEQDWIEDSAAFGLDLILGDIQNGIMLAQKSLVLFD